MGQSNVFIIIIYLYCPRNPIKNGAPIMVLYKYLGLCSVLPHTPFVLARLEQRGVSICSTREALWQIQSQLIQLCTNPTVAPDTESFLKQSGVGWRKKQCVEGEQVEAWSLCSNALEILHL